MEPIGSAGLVYLAHRTMPFLSWTPHTGCCPFSALRGHHEHHHTFNNPSRRPSSGWRRLLRTETPVGKKEIAAILKLSADGECLIAQEGSVGRWQKADQSMPSGHVSY